jgi:hypothetical protein
MKKVRGDTLIVEEGQAGDMEQRNIGGSEVQGETSWNLSTARRPGYMGNHGTG